MSNPGAPFFKKRIDFVLACLRFQPYNKLKITTVTVSYIFKEHRYGSIICFSTNWINVGTVYRLAGTLLCCYCTLKLSAFLRFSLHLRFLIFWYIFSGSFSCSPAILHCGSSCFLVFRPVLSVTRDQRRRNVGEHRFRQQQRHRNEREGTSFSWTKRGERRIRRTVAQGGPACLNYIGKKKHTWGVEREKRLSRFLMLKP